jgi:biotin carboxylase
MLTQYAKDNFIDGVFSIDEFGVQLAAKVSEAAKLPSMGAAFVELVQDKNGLRQACQKLDLPRPAFQKIPATTPKERRAGLIDSWSEYPCVVKPSAGAGSCFVQRVESRLELERAVIGILDNAQSDALIEGFLSGPEVDVDLCFLAGRCIFASVSDNFEPTAPFFMETGCACPSSLPDADDAAGAAIRVVTAVARNNGSSRISGVLHVEMRKSSTTGQWVIIEINPRIGGAETRVMVKAAYGWDLGLAAAMIACDLDPHAPLPSVIKTDGVLSDTSTMPSKAAPTGQSRWDSESTDVPELEVALPRTKLIAYSASINFAPPHKGKLTRIEVPGEVQRDASYEAHCFYYAAGDFVAPPPEVWSQLGWMAVSSPAGNEEARTILNDLVSRCVIEVDSSGC